MGRRWAVLRAAPSDRRRAGPPVAPVLPAPRAAARALTADRSVTSFYATLQRRAAVAQCGGGGPRWRSGRACGPAPDGMEHVNGTDGVAPPFLLNGASPGAAALTGALEAAFAVCSASGMPVSAATLARVTAPAGLTATTTGLPATPAGLSVTPSGAPAGPAAGSGLGPVLGPAAGPPAGVQLGAPGSGRRSVPALPQSPLLAGPPLSAAGVVFSRNRYGQGEYLPAAATHRPKTHREWQRNHNHPIAWPLTNHRNNNHCIGPVNKCVLVDYKSSGH